MSRDLHRAESNMPASAMRQVAVLVRGNWNLEKNGTAFYFCQATKERKGEQENLILENIVIQAVPCRYVQNLRSHT